MQSIFISILLILTTVAGLVINGYILVVIILTKQIKSANHILLFHLGAIEIFIGLLFLAFFIPGTNGKEWLPTGSPCLFHGFFFTLLQPLVLWTICGLNCDRFYIISVPLHYSRIVTSKKILIAIGTVWMTSILLSAPPVFTNTPFNFIPRFGICEPHITSGPALLWYSATYTIFSILLPVTFITICNVRIFIIARYHRHRIASAIYQVAISAQVAITHQKNPLCLSFAPMPTTVPPPQIIRPKFHNALYAMFQFVGSFMFLYVPYYCVILLEAFLLAFSNRESTKFLYEKHLNTNIYTISSSLLLLTVPVNGFLYGLKSKVLKQVLKNYWRKKQTKYDLNQEIQARTPSTCGSRRPSFHIKTDIIDVQKMLKTPFNQSTSTTNTLQVPSSNDQGVSLVTEDEIYYKLKGNEKKSAYKFLHNVFCGNEQNEKKYIPLTFQNKKDKSPKIMLTKANSYSVTSLNASFNKEESSTSCRALLQEGDNSDEERENS